VSERADKPRRRAPLGFGTGALREPVTLKVRATRPFVPERLLIMGDVVPLRFTVDGKAVPLLDATAFGLGSGYVVADDYGTGATFFELTLGPAPPPRAPRKWWQVLSRAADKFRARRFAAAAKGFIDE
jgi:hypothetical protein